MNRLPAPPARKMQYWLGRSVRAAREAQDVSMARIADALGIRELTIERFELGTHKTRETDQLLAAYAEVLGIEDPLLFYEVAMANWRGAGPPARPVMEEFDRPTGRAVAAAKRAARRSGPSPDESLETLLANPLPAGYARSG